MLYSCNINMNFNPRLRKGQVLTNQQLHDLFICPTRGDMRRSRYRNALLLINHASGSIHKNRWVRDVLHFTGMGPVGDQQLYYRQNKTLVESPITHVNVLLFEVYQKNRYTYKGKVFLDGEPYQEYQPDQQGNRRKVWMFPLRLIPGQKKPSKQYLSAFETEPDAVSDREAEYIPDGKDDRVLKYKTIKERRGQPGFRKKLLKRYGAMCMVSGTKLVHVIEAAHIDPYRGEQYNNLNNGILLRSDIHVLFDSGLLGIEPDTLRINIHPSIRKLAYGEYHLSRLKNCSINRPGKKALTKRWEEYKARINQP